MRVCFGGGTSSSRLRAFCAYAFLFLFVRTGVRKREIERRSLPHRAFGPHPAAMAVDNAAYGGQADAPSFELRRRMQALEGAKQLVGVGHVEPGAVVAYEVRRF